MDTPTTLCPTTTCANLPGGWRCLRLRAQVYLAVASTTAPCGLGLTPGSVILRGPDLCKTTRLVQILFSATPSPRLSVGAGRRCPPLRKGASVRGHWDRHRRLCPSLLTQGISRALIITALAGVITRRWAGDTRRWRGAQMWHWAVFNLRTVLPGRLRSGGTHKPSADWTPTHLRPPV